MDQREWDYGARMSRGRRAAEARPTRSPESPDLADPDQKWASLTDTGSLQPSEEALDWQRRADAWAQQAESETSQAVEPANRWSEVATGRPTFPADGVGWRTETAEWRATGARWRQTTEWRSTTGSHGWRSTTEAWQTGGSSSYPPQAETPMSQPALASSAWRSDEPSGHDDDARPAWQQFTDAAPEQESRHSTPSWQTTDDTPSWQQPQTSPPQTPYQQRPADPPSRQQSPTQTPSWQQPTTPSWQQTPQQPETSTPSWNQSSWLQQPEPPAPPTRQQPAPRPPAESSPSWQQLVDPTSQPGTVPAGPPPAWGAAETPAWRRGAIDGTATWSDLADARSRLETPSWQRSEGLPEQPASPTRDDGRHLVREDDRAAWRRNTGESGSQGGRRRAAEPGSGTSGGTGWTTRSDSDHWAGHTDTGNIQLYPDPAIPEAPSWGGVRREEQPTGRRALPATPHEETGYQIPPATPYETGRRGRSAETTGTRALPPGRTEEAPRGRRRAEEPPTNAPPVGRRAARYAEDEPEQGLPPRRAAAQSAAMPLDTRPPAAPYQDTGGPAAPYQDTRRPAGPSQGDRSPAVPYQDSRSLAAPYQDTRRPADPYQDGRRPASPRQDEQRPNQARLNDTRSGRRRRDEAPPPVDHRAAAQATPLDRRPDEMPPSGRRGVAAEADTKGRARYNPGRNDWREQTGSWEAEPDTSSWTRDPDTGQWSRAEDDPRVLAWRQEAARREELSQSGVQRALPAGLTPRNHDADETSVYGEPLVDDRDDDDPPPRRGGPRGGSGAPRSGTPYGGGSGAPRGGTPYGGGASAPRSAMPYGGGADAPRSGMPYGSPRGGAYSGAIPEDGPGYDDPRGGYGSAAPGRVAPGYDDPRGGAYGGTPANAVPGSGSTYGGQAGGPAGGPPSDTYGPAGDAYGPAGDAYGSAGIPGQAGPGRRALGSANSTPPRFGGSAPASSVPYGAGPAGGPPNGAPPNGSTPYGGAPAGDSGPYGGAPRSGTAYGAAAAPAGRRRAEPDVAPRGGVGPDVFEKPPLDPELWRRELEPPEVRQNRRLSLPDEAAPSWSESHPDDRQRLQAGEWQRQEREERVRGSATYRGENGPDDWRRDLAEQSNLAEGESRRYGTSDFVPFQSSGSAAVPRSSNLSMTSTSLISPVPREQREAGARPARASNGFQGLTGSYERRAVTGGFPTTGRRSSSNLLDPDDEEDDQEETAGPLAAVGYTVVWYGVPVVLFVLYMLVVNTGSRTHALDTLAAAAPQFGISLVLSVLVAYGLRFVSHSWKAISVGLAAAVVGGGLATVLTSAITGNSLS